MAVRSMTSARRFMLWLMKTPPQNPYVSCSLSVNFSQALKFLDKLKKSADLPRVSIQHLVAAGITRVYSEFPVARASVVAGDIQSHPHVGMIVLVDLLSEKKSRSGELGLIFLEKTDKKSLRSLAKQCRDMVNSEKNGQTKFSLLRYAMPIVEHLPTPVLNSMLDTFAWFGNLPLLGPLIHRQLPITVAITNPGSQFTLPEGVLIQGGSFSPPTNLIAVGSIVGLSSLQNMVVVEKGQPVVRPMLPLTYVWDHRLFDGVMAAKILTRLTEILLNPDVEFGDNGDRIIST